ncbi:MAG: helix-turn-helix-domain containing protein AraC type [Myxococcaceae bacterium]|nr:helix-turn-helix-domain containing protein AraC type [Myxococcaceae bacterium]
MALAMSTDALSEVLHAVRLTGAIFFDIDATSPWVAEAPAAREIAAGTMPGAGHVIEYHVVTAGACWAGLIDEPAIQLVAGEVVVFPQGDPHVVSSEPGMRGDPYLDLHRRPIGRQLPVLVNVGGGGSERTQIICGFLGCDARPFNPLLATLPRIMHVRACAGGVREQLVQLALMESKQRRAGSECTLARLSELLFIEVVREYLAELPPDSASWLGGLRDPLIGRVLVLLHDRPAHPWSLDELARLVGASRSVLAERFAHFAGMPPMQYLAYWRMQLAAGLLSSGSASVAEIAAQVGYGSEAAFSRAYKRLVGVAPASWRQGRRKANVAPALLEA